MNDTKKTAGRCTIQSCLASPSLQVCMPRPRPRTHPRFYRPHNYIAPPTHGAAKGERHRMERKTVFPLNTTTKKIKIKTAAASSTFRTATEDRSTRRDATRHDTTTRRGSPTASDYCNSSAKLGTTLQPVPATTPSIANSRLWYLKAGKWIEHGVIINPSTKASTTSTK